jgi:uncharacterized protein with HEPN domain
MRPEQLYLNDIVEAADTIVEFVTGMDEVTFYRDTKTQSAVLQKLIVIGEAAARLSKNFKDQYPGIEWRDIVAFRNILVHSYFSVKLDIVWETIQQDVPALRHRIARILEQKYSEP